MQVPLIWFKGGKFAGNPVLLDQGPWVARKQEFRPTRTPKSEAQPFNHELALTKLTRGHAKKAL